MEPERKLRMLIKLNKLVQRLERYKREFDAYTVPKEKEKTPETCPTEGPST